MATANVGLWKNKNIMYLFASQIFSALGDGICLLAILTLFGLEKDASPMEMAYVTLSLGLPFVLFGPMTGVLADKFERKKLMIISDLCRCVIMLAVVVSVNQIWILYVLFFLKGTFESLFTPAKNGKLKEYVRTEQMEQAVSITTVIDYGSKIVGPAAGGILVAYLGVNTAFYTNAVTFLLSALCLLGLGKRSVSGEEGSNTDERKESFMALFRGGLRFIRNNPTLLYGLLAFSIAMFVLTLTDSQLVVLIRELPKVPSSLFGMVMGAVGLGTLVAAALLSQIKLRNAVPYMAIGCLGVGLSFFLITLFTQRALGGVWSWYLPLGLLGGSFAALVFVPYQTMAQKMTPESLTSRVFGVIGSFSTLATIIGPLLGGVFIQAYGIFTVFYIASALLAVTSVVLIGVSRLAPKGERDLTMSQAQEVGDKL
ncbi:MFS transporter [Paenibacillus sp. M1]|uniref:MFS transporter n=1 Tax=Paenibacillus haidiansis TaxID=1574488 RepID=A0ABU7VN77_9BACL